jgi:predicted nucleic acid-binding protein
MRKTSRNITNVDSGFAYALIDSDDKFHSKAWSILRQKQWDFRVPAEIFVEVSHRRIGLAFHHIRKDDRKYRIDTFAENLTLLIERTPFQIEQTSLADYRHVTQLLHQYADAGIDFVDAVVVALAERFATPYIMTIDERDFRRYIPSFTSHFILPIFDQ